MKKMMAANWKMYKTRAETEAFFAEIAPLISNIPADREVLICAPATLLYTCSQLLPNGCMLGAENCHPAPEGAYTGEISIKMVRDAGCSAVLVGHSERRSLFAESDAFVGEKTLAAVSGGILPVVCVGETLADREAGNLHTVLKRQLDAALPQECVNASEKLVVAYEPVWAIGTGKVAGPTEIVEAHTLVREFLCARYGQEGNNIRILYGGSVKPDNAHEIIALDNVDGVLVGGASLTAESFSRIVLA